MRLAWPLPPECRRITQGGRFVMTKLIDETGKRYGRLSVLKRAESNTRRYATWLCHCECGNETIVVGTDLRSGDTRSCGCLLHKSRIANGHARALPKGEAALNALIRGMRASAKKRGLPWNLTKERVRATTKQHCFYCGVEPRQVRRQAECNGDYIYNGLDRIDNDKGYSAENTVACCGTCNTAKSQMTVGEFRVWIHRVHAYFAY